MKKKIKALLLSDVHFSEADEGLVNTACFDFGVDLKPDVIFLNGDIIDNYAISHYGKHPKSDQTLLKDVTKTREFLKKLRRFHPHAEIFYIFGNHEHRFESFIVTEAPQLFDFINLEQMLGLAELKIKCIRSSHRENWMKFRNLYVGHYDAARSEAGTTAAFLLRNKGVSLVQGHIHRVGMVAKRFLDRTLFAYENPCLAKMSVDYIKDPNWQQGFSVIYFEGNEHWLYPVVYKKRRFMWDGKTYKAKS